MRKIFIGDFLVDLDLLDSFWPDQSDGRPAIWIRYLPKSDGRTTLNQAVTFPSEAARDRAHKDALSQIKKLQEQPQTGIAADPEEQFKALVKTVGPERSAKLLAEMVSSSGSPSTDTGSAPPPDKQSPSQTRKGSQEQAEAIATFIGFKAKSWAAYYPGGNIKYPPVEGLEIPKSPVNRIKLLELLLRERSEVTAFEPFDLGPEDSLLGLGKRLPVVIPSGGKTAKWLGQSAKKKEFLWSRLLADDTVQVIFVVGDEDYETYSTAKLENALILRYRGFGIGCGRAAAMRVAILAKRMCVITDDRTQGLYRGYLKDEAKALEKNGALAALERELSKDPFWMHTAMPFGPCQVLSVVDPRAAGKKPLFPKCFIASKEDMALAEVMKLFVDHKVMSDQPPLFVSTDTKNPPIKNVARRYFGDKNKTLNRILASDLYRSSDGGINFNWTTLSRDFGFKNKWDAVKLQEAAMYQLLMQIVEQMLEIKSKEVNREFVARVLPFFM